MSTKTISAIYDNPKTASNAISILQTKGINENEISILASEGSFDKNIEIEENSKAPEGFSIGAGVGGAVGATIAGLTAVGTVTATGGVGLLAAGPVVAAFAGAGAGAATGGAIGGLVGMGFSETEAKHIDERLGSGNVLLGITVEKDRKEDVQSMLSKTGAEDVTVH